MVFLVLFLIAAAVAVYFAVRFFLLRMAIAQADGELKQINGHITQNHVLRLPVPDRRLGDFMNTINVTLQEVRRERVSYAARERAFRGQIEAVSHDLRTPLTVIIGYLDLLSSRTDDEEVGIVLRKARSMQKLVAAFYEYSRVVSGDYALDCAVLDENRVLSETIADNCIILEEKGLDVTVKTLDCPAQIVADRAALERVIVNLMQNASRYAASYLAIENMVVSGQVVTTFENDAEGLTEETIAHLFDRFYTGDATRAGGGTGLGLTIAKELTEQMGGALTAQLIGSSRPAVRFTLSFPLAKIQA